MQSPFCKLNGIKTQNGLLFAVIARIIKFRKQQGVCDGPVFARTFPFV